MLNKQEFIDYIGGKLSLKRKAKVDAYLKEHPLEEKALQAAVEYSETEPIPDILERLDKKIDKKISDRQLSKVEHLTKRKVISLRRWLSIAASVLLFCAAGYFLLENQESSSEKLFAQHFDLYPDNITEIERGEGEQMNQLVSGINYYEHKKFDQAIVALSDYYESPKVRFFIAISELGKGNAAKSLLLFRELEQNEEMVDMQDGLKWYIALAFLKNNDPQKAKKILEDIAASNHYKKEEAKKILANF